MYHTHFIQLIVILLSIEHSRNNTKQRYIYTQIFIDTYIFQLELKHSLSTTSNKIKKGLINLFSPHSSCQRKKKEERGGEKKTNEKQISLINLRLIVSKTNRQPTVPIR